jgi:hypothetical protein
VDNLEAHAQLFSSQNHSSGSKDSAAPASMSNAQNTVDNHQTPPARGPEISKSASTSGRPSLPRQLSGQTCNDQQQPSNHEGATTQQPSMDWSLPYLPRYLWPPGQQQPIAPNPAYQNASLSPKTMEERLLECQSMPKNGVPLAHIYFPYQDIFNQKGVARKFAFLGSP